ncbi:hypothetical protein Tco_0658868 [Tanacetum coccineum]
MVSMDDEEWFDHYLGQACFDDQSALVAGTSAGFEANKVVNDGDDSESSSPVRPTSDSESSSKLEMKVLVDGKQDEAKVVKVVVVAVKQNIDEPDVEGNVVIGVGVNENKKGVQYSVSTLHVLILLLERLNAKYIKKKKMKAEFQRRIWKPDIKIESIQRVGFLPSHSTLALNTKAVLDQMRLKIIRFEESVRNCFGPSEYEDPNGALSKLLQLRTREFLVSRPTTLGDAFSLAIMTEARMDDQAAPVAGTMTKTFGNNGVNASETSDHISDDEDPLPHDLADSDVEDLINDDDGVEKVYSSEEED